VLTPHQTRLAGWLGKQAAELAKRATVGPVYNRPAPAQTPAQGRAVAKPPASAQTNMGSKTGTGLVGGDLFKQKLNDSTAANGIAT